MKVYLDNSATTQMDKSVFEEMMPYFVQDFGNANSLHSFGQRAAGAVAQARQSIARALNCKNSEIYFTSGGTEADNWALKGVMHAHKAKGNHFIISAIEHAAVKNTAEELKREGFLYDIVPVDDKGRVDLLRLEQLIKPSTVLISIILANNEVGTIQDIDSIVKIAHEHKVLVHTDAVQAVGSIEVDIAKMGVDLLSLSAHKFYGPKGIGMLFVKSGTKMSRLICGGEQERTMRGGTTNVALVVGLASALQRAVQDLQKNAQYVSELRDYFEQGVLSQIEHVVRNGDVAHRLPQNSNLSFRYIEGEALLLRLDLEGIAVSSGSACSSNSLQASHVLLALGMEEEMAHGSIRFSFGKNNTKEEIDYVLKKLKDVVQSLRVLSPFKADGQQKLI